MAACAHGPLRFGGLQRFLGHRAPQNMIAFADFSLNVLFFFSLSLFPFPLLSDK